MGGGGSYYDRDVPDRSTLTSRGVSREAEEEMQRSSMDPDCSPRDRLLVCKKKNPIAFGFDVTGSMDTLPKIIRDKGPLMARELTLRNYFKDPAISLTAIGDLRHDRAPLQVGDFSLIRGIDGWMQRLWLERGGGGNHRESYELAAYFYAYHCDLPNAVTPICLFTGDEGFYDMIAARDLNRVFGDQHEDVDSQQVFDDLKAKFKGNVYLIHRRYGSVSHDRAIVRQWQSVLGADRVILLKSDRAVMDISLGLCALASRTRTLEEYCEDMRTRTNADTGEVEPQSEERIAEVRQALE